MADTADIADTADTADIGPFFVSNINEKSATARKAVSGRAGPQPIRRARPGRYCAWKLS